MPKPKTKLELQAAVKNEFDSLFSVIKSYPPKQRDTNFKSETMNRNIRDVLAHVYHWQKLFLTWYEQGMAGEKPNMPAEGYTWKMTPQLNKEIWKSYQQVELKLVEKKLKVSHVLLTNLMMEHDEIELFTKKKYKWTGSTSLAAYLISASSSHYQWAIKIIKKGMKNE